MKFDIAVQDKATVISGKRTMWPRRTNPSVFGEEFSVRAPRKHLYMRVRVKGREEETLTVFGGYCSRVR